MSNWIKFLLTGACCAIWFGVGVTVGLEHGHNRERERWQKILADQGHAAYRSDTGTWFLKQVPKP